LTGSQLQRPTSISRSASGLDLPTWLSGFTCARPECRQIFFLCSRCDRGHRYCGACCRNEARRRSLREAGRRYQATRDGRFAHAARQRRYAERPQKVTHQSPRLEADAARVPPALDLPAMKAPPEPSAKRTLSHAEAEAEAQRREAWATLAAAEPEEPDPA
jgi:hypothetical protein